jgi:hypothetical protein
MRGLEAARAVGQDIHVHARAGSEGVESDGTQTVVETGGNGGGTKDGAGEVDSSKTERQPEGMCRQEGLGWRRAERGQRDSSTMGQAPDAKQWQGC